MSESVFFDPGSEPQSPKKADVKIPKKKMYANDGVLDEYTEGMKFDFKAEGAKFVNDLERLVHMSVEEFTFYKKFEEIKLLNEYIKNYSDKAWESIWTPTDLNNEELTIKEITELQPVMEITTDEESERKWTALRIFCSSAEFNQAPGRFFKFFLKDLVSNKILGIVSIASDVIAIADRDKYIGWTSEDKLKHRMLKHSAIGTTIVPTQPFGTNFLGGKLLAAMVTTDVVRKTWEAESGEGIPCKLVGMTTTSLYGEKKGNFSMYNGLKWWKPVGLSKGKIPIKPFEQAYSNWHGWLKQHKADDYNEAMTQKENVKGPVTGAKMRVLSLIFKVLDLKQSNYVHGFERGVYYSCFYENTKEFLCRKITEDKLVMKPLFKEDTKAVLDWWKPKAIERYKKLKVEGRLNPNKLFYNKISDSRMEYDDAKKLYFKDVGR